MLTLEFESAGKPGSVLSEESDNHSSRP